MIKIALDAMGGDHAPYEIVRGAVKEVREQNVEIILVGQENVIKKELDKCSYHGGKIDILHAEDAITMEEPPAQAVRRKRDSSIIKGINLLKEGEVSAFASAGSTGAIMIASLLTLGNIGGINRPALSTVFRSLNGPVILLDIGANVDCRPAHIVQFAHMGSIYMEKVFGIQNPRVGLLSNGEESSKGSELVRKSHKLLSQNGLNFIGNVEGVEIPKGVVDVVVTDGFTGNAVAKVSEGLGEAFFEVVQGSKNKSFVHKLLSFVVRPYFRSLEKQALEWAGSGGSLLLGVEGTVVIGHGRSHAESVKKILEVAKSSAEQEVLEAMKEDLRAIPTSVPAPVSR